MEIVMKNEPVPFSCLSRFLVSFSCPFSCPDETTRLILDGCPQLDKDRDLKGYNKGVTIVLL